MTTTSAISTSAGAISSSSPSISVPSIGNAITVRLSRDNFFLWKAQATPVLRAQQLFGFVDGSVEAPSKLITEGTGDAARQVPNPAYLRWFTQDQLVLSALVSSMNEDMLGQMTQYTTARDVWTALHAMFSAQNRAQIMQLRYQLSNTKKKDMTAAAYFQKMKGLADTMASIGNPLSDEEVLGYMLAGLGADFEPLVATITARDAPLGLHSFYAQLISAELRHERNTSPTCQPEENRDRAGNSSAAYNVDTNWYADSGATDHLTSDLDRLNVQERYTGKDNVQVANGSVFFGPNLLRAPVLWICVCAKIIIVNSAITVAGFGVGMVYFGMPLSVGNLGTNLYLSVAYNALAELPSAMLSWLLIARFDRRSAVVALSVAAAACSLACVAIPQDSTAARMAAELLSFFATCTAYDVILIYSIELFPTAVRNSAVGLVRQAMVLGGVVAPVLIAFGQEWSFWSFGVFGLAIGCSGLFAACLPETNGRTMSDTMEEEEERNQEAVASCAGTEAIAQNGDSDLV
ncbi:hypothetical protein ACP70R_014296 [Stipagrostis hirtigluma subsp. patula]